MSQTSAAIPTTDRTQATPTLYNNLVNDITDLHSRNISGWEDLDDTWAYGAAQVATVGDDSLYQAGDRVRWKQGAGYLYGMIL